MKTGSVLFPVRYYGTKTHHFNVLVKEEDGQIMYYAAWPGANYNWLTIPPELVDKIVWDENKERAAE